MDKLIINFSRHLRAMWRYRRIGLFTAWVVATLSVAIVFVIPKKYEASARVFVNTDSILKPLMEGMTVPPNNGQRVALLSRLVISRPNVEQLIKEAGLAANARTTEQYERLIDHVIDVLAIESAGEKNNLYVLKYRDTEPQRAKRMVELLVAKFINSSKGGQATDTNAARKFLDEQADSYEKKLQEADGRLKEFKLQNIASNVSGESKDYISQMSTVKDQLSQAKLQLREAENSRDAYRRSLEIKDIAAEPILGTNGASDAIADFNTRIDAMKRNLNGLLQKYTEIHPDVADTRRMLRELNEQRDQLVEEYRTKGTLLTTVKVTVKVKAAETIEQHSSELLKVALAQAEASVASFQARVAEYTTRYNQLRDTGQRLPEYEAQLAQLNRDYQINKKKYDELATRRESANIAGDMQSVSGVDDFRLIDPPRVSPASSSSHAVLLAGGLVFALFASLGIMFLAKEIFARFYDRSQLRETIALPVLGVISVIANDERTRENKKRLTRFILTAGMLFAIYVGVVITGILLTKPVA